LNTTISRINISGIEQMRKFAKAYGLGINFTLSSISEIGVESRKVKNRFELLNEENAFLVSFFKDLLVKKEISDEYGNFVLNWLFTGRRLVACNFRKQAAILIEPNGDAFFCGNFREFRIGSLVNGTYTALAKGFKAPQSKYRDRCKACNSNCYMDVN
jgi:sulfatase maturation enzyme AslB (radical SAM superfamily)